jgi:hypothetical protein
MPLVWRNMDSKQEARGLVSDILPVGVDAFGQWC